MQSLLCWNKYSISTEYGVQSTIIGGSRFRCNFFFCHYLTYNPECQFTPRRRHNINHSLAFYTLLGTGQDVGVTSVQNGHGRATEELTASGTKLNLYCRKERAPVSQCFLPSKAKMERLLLRVASMTPRCQGREAHEQ